MNNNKRLALSWSGGKDSCLALHQLKKLGYDICCLITTVPKETGKTFAHGEKLELIQAQSDALNIPIYFVHCAFDTYTEDFKQLLFHLKDKYLLNGIAFGDLYIEDHRQWGEQLAASVGLEAVYPLWRKQTQMLQSLTQFIKTGYKAIVIRIRHHQLPKHWLGRQLDEDFWEDIQKKKVCPMGESGEYHTYVYDGPLFQASIKIKVGKIIKEQESFRLEINEGNDISEIK